MANHQIIDLYLKAVDLAKQREGLSNQDKMILNKFKILLLGDVTDDVDKEYAQIGKVRKTTVRRVRELAESIFEDWVRRNGKMIDGERERILAEGKKRADATEEALLKELELGGFVSEN
jgi:hypothetical protein